MLRNTWPGCMRENIKTVFQISIIWIKWGIPDQLCIFWLSFRFAHLTTLKTDIVDKGYSCHLIPFEVGSRGYISKSNKTNLMNIFLVNKLKPNIFKCMREMSKISLLCSFSIHTPSPPGDPHHSWSDRIFMWNYENKNKLCCGPCW